MTCIGRHFAAALLLASTAAHAAAAPGDLDFEFDGWAGPAIPVRMYVPEAADDETPIVIVMHGASRDAPRYYADWRTAAAAHGFIAVVPYFSKNAFPGSANYNLGRVFDQDTREKCPEAGWTYSAIEPLFDAIVAKLGGRQAQYTLYGHSAGSQFAHRFLYFVPDARVRRAILANAGWYTMPDFGVAWPYGLAGSGVDDDVLAGYFARDVVVLLGDADTVREDETLRKTPEAELQGRNRYNRGHTFYRVGRARAETLGTDFGWRVREVRGAAHSNAAMTPAAAEFVTSQ